MTTHEIISKMQNSVLGKKYKVLPSLHSKLLHSYRHAEAKKNLTLKKKVLKWSHKAQRVSNAQKNMFTSTTKEKNQSKNKTDYDKD